MKTKLVSLILALSMGFNLCCGTVAQTDPNIVADRNEIAPIPSTDTYQMPDSADALLLCERLKDLKEIPYSYDDVTDDSIYNGLKEAGKVAFPCLIDKITDVTPMHDPGPGPVVQNYKVGDAAVFMLLIISQEEWQPDTMLSPRYAQHWESEGIYAYFAYVKNPHNRKKIQQWWREWMEKKETKLSDTN